MSQSFKLYRLQQVDSQLDRANARLREIEIELSKDESLRRAEADAHRAALALQKERQSLRAAEENVREQHLKIEQTEATLYGGKVRNPKELQDLQNEAASLKRYRSVLEDRQLEAMIAVEEAEARQAAAQEKLEQVRQSVAQQHGELNQTKKDLLNEVARLETERQAATSSIPEEDMRLYEQLRKQRRGVAVAKVSDRACSACGSTLSAALLSASRSPNQITRCDTCGRILYGG
jgi:predicted  nucleic acid-binding Zn-ribbon protein